MFRAGVQNLTDKRMGRGELQLSVAGHATHLLPFTPDRHLVVPPYPSANNPWIVRFTCLHRDENRQMFHRTLGTSEKPPTRMAAAPRPTADGLPAGATYVYCKQAPMSWGKLGSRREHHCDAVRATRKGSDLAYETGVTMDYESLAPARRGCFF